MERRTVSMGMGIGPGASAGGAQHALAAERELNGRFGVLALTW
jgi:hypothetical protein